jgi:death-on-curing protein
VIYLTIDDICEINRLWIALYGGRYVEENNNFLNKSSLQYILTAIQYPVFGLDLYPTLVEKAAALLWWIAGGHIFVDGNKRTGMQAAIELLEVNDVITKFDNDAIIAIPLAVANKEINLQDLYQIISNYI